MDNNGIISEMQLKQKTSPPASDKLYRKHWRGGFHYQLETLSLLVANIEGPPCCSPSRTTKLRICIFDKKKYLFLNYSTRVLQYKFLSLFMKFLFRELNLELSKYIFLI